ncbi:SusC/RagA family TonB-linked outer membrane protein [Ohtaekwangia koreensis]|uniref:TonB-linked outer membrane protein, SusC/RagA family n=1 Tax=Ohtaekwangia koreensis TaxID=688867 RepID=A0A1T5IWD9_9BACT|nr:TonB-dependent receptor [Ohtaekwangia koreensis]SKC43516.1 TonB-linked outer membrane protein, SusC/RagA family [Ohtaekwangia koreensis]
MTKFLRYCRRLWLLGLTIFAMMVPVHMHAQDVQITGTVTSGDNAPLPGVNVLVKGTTMGTVTDVEGKYALSAPGSGTLIFTFIGMKTMEVDIANRAAIDIVMDADISQLDEVVVVGYGTQKKSDLTGSVSSISSKDIKTVPVASLSQALQGRAAGVQVTQVSNAPGGGVSIRIRGGNSIQGGNEPLYVVDGYPLTNENGPTISPNDIESMEILKDASATAIYGSRGANGVVIITTKRGKAGKPSILFESYYGMQEVRKKLDMLDATQLAQLINEGIANVNADNVGKPGFPKALTYTDEQIAALGKGTNWQDEIFREAPVQNYQLTISGGNDKTQYSVSGNLYDQDGIIINSGYKRTSFRLNLDTKVTDKLKISNSLTVSNARTNTISSDTDGGGSAGVVYAALNFSPTVPVYNADGSYTIDNRLGGIKISNPVALANETKNRTTITRMLGNVSGEYLLAKGLTLKVLLGANLAYNKTSYYQPRTVYASVGTNGSAYINSSQTVDWLNENTLNYQTTLNDRHKFNILLGYTLQAVDFEEYRASGQNFANDILENNNLGSAQQTNTSTSNVTHSALRSYIGRINYDLDGKYLVTLTTRIDGSSRFGKGNKNSLFPSGSFAWRIANEPFMADIRQVSDLKIRASYGITGNQEIGNYQSLSSLTTQNYNFGGTFIVGYSPNRIANPDLKWETTAQFDVGLDFGLFNDRISITADWYLKKTRDLLYSVSLPITSGFNTSLQNIGKVQNKGIEFSISSVNVDKALRWTTNFNISANRNKILDLGNVKGDIPAGSASGHLQLANSGILRVGEPIGVFYGLETDGIFQNQAEIDASAQKTAKPGDRRYKDLTPDGAINSSDRTILGYAQPKYIFGFTNSFSYKGFNLSIFFVGSQGNSVYNINRYELESLTGISNQSAVALNRWTPENPSNEIPRATSTGNPYQVTSRQVEDGSYIRMRNIQLGYTFPSEWMERLRLASARIYISGQNLLTITDYSGYDPEVSRFGQDNLSQGIDYGSYPTAKMYLVGLNIGF